MCDTCRETKYCVQLNTVIHIVFSRRLHYQSELIHMTKPNFCSHLWHMPPRGCLCTCKYYYHFHFAVHLARFIRSQHARGPSVWWLLLLTFRVQTGRLMFHYPFTHYDIFPTFHYCMHIQVSQKSQTKQFPFSSCICNVEQTWLRCTSFSIL